MILSSVNFVAKPKVGKCSNGKIKKKDTTQPVKEEPLPVASFSEMCKKEDEEENTIFRFPTPSSRSLTSQNTSGYGSDDGTDLTSSLGDCVTIATGDDLCLTVDQFYYTVGLRDAALVDSTCIFRKKVLSATTATNGRTETVVFVLDCDQEFYLTTSKTKGLELNYFPSMPCADLDDTRTFLLFYTDICHIIIQPKLHRHVYLHHMDKSLDVQPFDLNSRCPEEYFFHFNIIPEPRRSRYSMEQIKICTHQKLYTTVENGLNLVTMGDGNNIDYCKSTNLHKRHTSNVSCPSDSSCHFQMHTNKKCKKHIFCWFLLGCVGGLSRQDNNDTNK